jgi:hypothetical protein
MYILCTFTLELNLLKIAKLFRSLTNFENSTQGMKMLCIISKLDPPLKNT